MKSMSSRASTISAPATVAREASASISSTVVPVRVAQIFGVSTSLGVEFVCIIVTALENIRDGSIMGLITAIQLLQRDVSYTADVDF